MRKAKIVCTLGPASTSEEAIRGLVEAGMDCARLNFSHGTHADHLRVAQRVRAAAAAAGRPLAILGDLSGPKMRVGTFPDGPIDLVPGRRFTLTTRPIPGGPEIASVSYQALALDAQIGTQLLLDDGLLRLRVVEIDGTEVHCEVEVGGVLSDRKGLNIPGVPLSAPALTEKDKLDLAFAVDVIGVDYLALSFVRSAADVRMAQHLAKGTPVIAKIEKPEAVRVLDEILDVADGAMVARGDLGVEIGPEKVPLVQKRIIRETNKRSKMVITATQMLDSMIRNPSPTRAEAADVANAVIDGTDAVMLSGETAVGLHPALAVQMMDRIICEVESEWSTLIGGHIDPTSEREWGFADAAAKAAAVVSHELPIAALVVYTRDGRTANLLSEYRPPAPIVAISQDPRVANKLALEWGVIPRVEVPPEHLQESVRLATGLLLREGIAQVGDAFAIVVGWPVGSGTNTLKLHRI